MDTQLNALPTLAVLARTVSGYFNSAFLGLELNRSGVGKTAISLVSPRPQRLTPSSPARRLPGTKAVSRANFRLTTHGGGLRFLLLACNRSTLFPKHAPYPAIQSPCKANAVPVAASFKKPVPERPRRLAVKPSSALALRVQASSFLYGRSKHASQTHRFLIRRAEAADQDRSWVHEFPVDQLRVFAGTYAHDQRAGFLAVEAPLTSSMTVPRAAVALSSAATV